MLKTLRTRLAKICMLITATLLAMMSLISLGILEKQFNAQQYTLIENQLNSIVFRLQTERSISHTFLSKLEATNQLLIKIEDNGIPLLFKVIPLLLRLELNFLQKQLLLLRLTIILAPLIYLPRL